MSSWSRISAVFGGFEPGLKFSSTFKPSNGLISDISGNDNNGTVNGAIYNEDIIPSQHFCGSDDFVTITNNGTLNLDGEMTFSGWVFARDYSHAEGGGTPRILFKNAEYQVYANTSSQLVFLTNGVSPSIASAADGLILNVWNHFVCTYSATNGVRRIYINGLLVTETTGLSGNTPVTGNPFYIGNRVVGSGTNSWRGFITGIRVLDYAVNSDWVIKNYTKLYKVGHYWRNFETFGPISFGQVGSAPVITNSGSYSIDADGLLSNGAGNCYMPGGFITPEPKQNAYGRWICYITIPVSTFDSFYTWLGTGIDYNTTGGYWLVFTHTGRLTLVMGGVGNLFQTPEGTLQTNIPIKIEVSRTYDGEISVYINDVLAIAESGTNPVTDNTTQSLTNVVFNAQTGVVFQKFEKLMLPRV